MFDYWFPKSTFFICISMAIQQGNVQCVQGAYGESAFEELDAAFNIILKGNKKQYSGILHRE